MRILARSMVAMGLFALFTAPLSIPAAQAAESALITTRIGTAHFDPATSAIVVPYTGAAPKLQAFTITGSHHYYDLPASRLERDAVQFHRVGGGIERYTLADRPDGMVRVSFKLTTVARPTFELDSRRQRVLIWPLGKRGVLARAPIAPVLPKAPATPAPAFTQGVRVPIGLTPPNAHNALKTEVGKPTFDDFHRRLILPYSGEEPAFTVVAYDKNPKWVYVDFANAYISAEGQRFETFAADSAFEGWMLSQRKDGLKTRLYLKLKAASRVLAHTHPESKQIWLEVPARQAPEAAPGQASPLPDPEPI